MFSNFLYFLVALLIYTTSELFDKPAGENPDNLAYCLVLSLSFVMVCHLSFRRLFIRARLQRGVMDQAISNTVSRLSMLALGVFAANIYIYRLNDLLSGVSLFAMVPTFKAVLFLGLFLLYLVAVWNAAYGVQKYYFPGEISKRDFLVSNISFALPALLPWFCLSLFADMIRFLPPSPVRGFLVSPAGEMLYILMFLGAVSVFGPGLIKSVWRCKPLAPGYSRQRIQAVCDRAGLKYADILRWDLFGGSMITAGVMGLVGWYRYILVTPALLHALDDDELDAVMLHEIGHVQNHHMLFYIFFFAGFIACNFVFFEPMMLLLYIADPLYQAMEFLGVDRDTAHSVFISGFLISFFVLYFRFGFGFFMRNFERQADIHLYRFGADARPLIRTFHKIASMSRQSMERPNWHHFSIGQRIRFLENCQESPALISQHHARVKKMMAVYTSAVLLVCGIGYSINYGPLKEPFGDFIAEQVLIRQLEVEPENSELYVLVGDYWYNKQAWAKAADAWENVIRIDGRNLHALNNLAWLLSTCPDPGFRDYPKALDLASRALAVKREPFVLDTYAEALYANNRLDEAIVAAREALASAEDKHAYYREQVARFEEQKAAL